VLLLLQKCVWQDTLENFDKGLFEETPTPFSDYRHREVFQINLDLIECYYGITIKKVF